MTGTALRYIALWLLFIGACGAVILTAPPLNTDLTQFLPRAGSHSQSLLLDELKQGAATRMLLLELAGAPGDELAQASTQLARILKDSDHFSDVNNGGAALGAEVESLLFPYRYLLADTALTTESLHAALAQREKELATPLGLLYRRHLPADPTGTFRQLLQSWATDYRPNTRQGVWFTRDGCCALIMLRSDFPALELDMQEAALAAIEQAFAPIRQETGITLSISGVGKFAVDSRALIRSQARQLSILASLGVGLLLWFVFRSLRLALVVALPLFTGIIAATAAVTLLFGAIHGITLAFGITLIGIAVDYPIHLFTHTAFSVESRRAMHHIWPTLRLGLITTALGFSALLFSGFGGLSQLGTFAIVGLLAATAATRFVLPVLVPRFSLPTSRTHWLRPVTPPPRLKWLAPLCIIATLPYLGVNSDRLWEHDMARLSPVSAEAKTLDRRLRGEFGIPQGNRVLLIEAANPEALLQLSEALEQPLSELVQRRQLAGYQLPSRYLPSQARQRQRQAALPDAPTLRQAMQQAVATSPFRPGLFTPFLEAVEQSRGLEPLTFDALHNSSLGLQLETRMRVYRDHWMGIIPLYAVADEQALRAVVREIGGNIHYLDLTSESSRMVASYRDETLIMSGYGLLGAALVLLWALRARRVWRVLAPVTAAILLTTALLHLLGQQLSLFHIAALLLVLGIGLDYALFIERTPSSHPHFAATALALITCSLTTLMVFGLLATTAIPVLQAIGLTVSIGALLSLILSATMVHNDARPK